MNSKFIYTDFCCDSVEKRIKEELGLDLVKRFPDTSWSINEAMKIICLPLLEIAVINVLDEKSIMEIALLSFMCKKILVTANSINQFEDVTNTIDHIDFSCDLRKHDSKIIEWYKELKHNG